MFRPEALGSSPLGPNASPPLKRDSIILADSSICELKAASWTRGPLKFTEEHATSGSTSLASHKVNIRLKANTVLEYKVRVKEFQPLSFSQPPFKDLSSELAPCAGQMHVIADTGVNIQLKISRLDNRYMLLVPINLIAVFLFLILPFTRQGNVAHSFLWRVFRWAHSADCHQLSGWHM